MHRPEENISVREVRALVADARHFGELLKCLMKIIKHAVRSVEAVLCNVLPNMLQVSESTPCEFE
jgi:hypothetical protein